MADPFALGGEETITLSYKGGQSYKEGLFVWKGSPEDAAKRMAIADWDGKISSLLKRHQEITAYNDKLHGQAGPKA